jgi:hypothetical protein
MQKGLFVPFFKKYKQTPTRDADYIYDVVNDIHTRGKESQQESNRTLIRYLVEDRKTQSLKGLRRALECGDFELSDYLWKHNLIVCSGDLSNICFSIRAMQWAKERNLPFTEYCIYLICHVWNGDEVHDRLLFLFKECGLKVRDNTIWNTISIRGVAYLGYRWCDPCSELCTLIERTCDLAAFHKGLAINWTKCVDALISYDELVTLCQYSGLYIRDVFVFVLQSKQIKDTALVDIITNVFNVCRKGDFYVNLSEMEDLFTVLVENGKIEAATTLGMALKDPGLDAKKRKTIEVDWKFLVDTKIQNDFESCYDSDDKNAIYTDWIDEYERFQLISPIQTKRLTTYLIKEDEDEDIDYSSLSERFHDCAYYHDLRKKAYLCLCATKYDKKSYFNLLPYALVQWMIKMYILHYCFLFL